MGIIDSRKITFAALNAFLFLLIASPPIYRIVAWVFDLNYDDEQKNNRISLLFIHTFVFSLLTIILVNVYSPV